MHIKMYAFFNIWKKNHLSGQLHLSLFSFEKKCREKFSGLFQEPNSQFNTPNNKFFLTLKYNPIPQHTIHCIFNITLCHDALAYLPMGEPPKIQYVALILKEPTIYLRMSASSSFRLLPNRQQLVIILYIITLHSFIDLIMTERRIIHLNEKEIFSF